MSADRRTDRRALAGSRVARHQRARRLRRRARSRGVATRRYHGLLIAALPAPLGRTMMLSHLWRTAALRRRATAVLSGEDERGTRHELLAAGHLTEFRLEDGLPVWRYEVGGVVVEKRLVSCRTGRTRCIVTYRLLAGRRTVRLNLRPSVHFRAARTRPSATPLAEPYHAHARSPVATRSRRAPICRRCG